MKKWLTVLFFPFLSVISIAQNGSTTPGKKQQPNIAYINSMDGEKVKGWFFKMDDEHIYLLPASRKTFSWTEFKKPDLNNKSFQMDVSAVNTIKLQKKNASIKGALLGLGIGAVTGALIGFVSGDDPVTPYTGTAADIFISLGSAFTMTAGQKALWGGVAFGLTGAGIGALIGVLKKKLFVIGGKKETYRDLQGELMKRIMVNN